MPINRTEHQRASDLIPAEMFSLGDPSPNVPAEVQETIVQVRLSEPGGLKHKHASPVGLWDSVVYTQVAVIVRADHLPVVSR